MSRPRLLLVGLDSGAVGAVERGASIAGGIDVMAVPETAAIEAAQGGDPPAAVVIAARVSEPIKLVQSLVALDPDTAITLLTTPEDRVNLQEALRFAPFVNAYTTCRSADDLGQLGVDMVEAAQAAVKRRAHRVSVAAAGKRALDAPGPLWLRREALGRLVEDAPIGVVSLDAARQVVGWNAHAARLIGKPDQAVLRRPVAELFAPSDGGRLDAVLDAAMRGEPEPRPVVLRQAAPGEAYVEVVAGESAGGESATLMVLSDVTERVLTERARRRAEADQSFLADTGALLDASLDPVETLQRIAALAVPARAELCVVDLLTEDGAIEGVAVAAVDEGVADAVQSIRRRYPIEPAGVHPVARVVKTGEAEILEEMTEDTYRRIAQSDEHLALMRRLHYHSALVAPLVARGHTFGAISLLHLDPDRRYAPADLRVLEDVARRAALALDNARLYERERRIAETLQRSLLPARLPELPGLSLAARYEPGDGDVGGDWYDVIPLGDGRLACVVGDIVGRGIKAASIMGQLRNAVRVYALERESSADVLNAVDRLSDALELREMATIGYVVVDPAARTIDVASAGHPPPLVIHTDGTTQFLMDGRSGPVGVGLAGTHTCATEPLPPGSLVLMYSDGLVERRGVPLDDGLARFETAAAAVADRPVDEIASTVVRLLRADAHADDVALLVVRAEPVTDLLRLSLPAELTSVPVIRRELRRWLEGRLPEEDAYDVVLACSEACANAVEHAYLVRRGTVEVEASMTDDEVTIVVRDFGRWRREGGSGRGRGTPIMRATMDDVDITSGESGTQVVLMRRRDRAPA